MGYQMFHTTPEAVGEVQPLADADGRNRIVFDGRVDNREDLAAAVRARGAVPRDNTDTELVLCAYGCFGEDITRRIIGDFALVIWNAAEHTLFCAIDPARRDDYVRAVLRRLAAGGHYLAVNYLIPDTDGPPFGTTRQELMDRFCPHFDLQAEWVPRSYPNRTGLELMLWWQRKKG